MAATAVGFFHSCQPPGGTLDHRWFLNWEPSPATIDLQSQFSMSMNRPEPTVDLDVGFVGNSVAGDGGTVQVRRVDQGPLV